jgi:hypothetical protein
MYDPYDEAGRVAGQRLLVCQDWRAHQHGLLADQEKMVVKEKRK